MSATATLPELPDVPLVSVLTLTYNHEEFVAEAIESVLAQEWPADRVQHVVLNDGSSDGTSRVLDRYRSRVTVIEQANAGMRASVDRVMGVLSGDVITVVDGDDAMLPGRIERQVRALREHPLAGLVYTDAQLVDRAGEVLRTSFIDAAGLPRVSGRVRGRLLERNVASGGAVMLRGCLKHLIHPLPPHAVWPDYWWAWAISGVGEVAHVPEPTYRYRAHGANQTLGTHAQNAANVTKELPFRLHMLGHVEQHEATATELLTGIVVMWRLLEQAPAETVDRLTATAGASGQAVAWLDGARVALEAGDLHGCAFACARAAASNPRGPGLLAVVGELARQLEGSAPPRPDRDVLDSLGARRRAVLVDAGALLATPQMLDTYAQRFGGDADVTLVIHAGPEAAARQTSEIPRLVADRGLDGPDGPDMVLVSEPVERLRALARSVDAVLGDDTFDSGAPTFGIDELDSLAALLGQPADRRERAACGPGVG